MNRCPHCNSRKNQVFDSRPHDGTVKRRRRCLSCDSRWSTFEVSESTYAAILELDQALAGVGKTLSTAMDAIGIARNEGLLLQQDYDLESNGHRKLRKRRALARSTAPAPLIP